MTRGVSMEDVAGCWVGAVGSTTGMAEALGTRDDCSGARTEVEDVDSQADNTMQARQIAVSRPRVPKRDCGDWTMAQWYR